MKRLLIWAMVLTSIICVSCTKEDDLETGSIYGVVTEAGSTRVLKGIQVKLYKGRINPNVTSTNGPVYIWTLLLTTTTFDDGHFEFLNLDPGIYGIKIPSNDYYDLSEEVNDIVTVESGRQARIDLQASF